MISWSPWRGSLSSRRVVPPALLATDNSADRLPAVEERSRRIVLPLSVFDGPGSTRPPAVERPRHLPGSPGATEIGVGGELVHQAPRRTSQ